jgi:hypothetical protein
MHRRASGKHQIVYAIGCDADDPQTVAAAYVLALGAPTVSICCMERLGSLGEVANRLAARHPADVYCSLCDDVEILTPHWDEQIARMMAKRPDGVWWWEMPKGRQVATYAIVSDRWYRAAGYIFTDYFPFWWDDVWLLQLWNMASGEKGAGVGAFLSDIALSTHRLRDLHFWTKFYQSKRPERIAEAARIAKALGWPAREVNGQALGDVREGFWEEAPSIEKKQGDKGPPTREYLAARSRAEAMMGSTNGVSRSGNH